MSEKIERHTVISFCFLPVYYNYLDCNTAGGILAIFRKWKNKDMLDEVERIKNTLVEKLPTDNLSTLEYVYVI